MGWGCRYWQAPASRSNVSLEFENSCRLELCFIDVHEEEGSDISLISQSISIGGQNHIHDSIDTLHRNVLKNRIFPSSKPTPLPRELQQLQNISLLRIVLL